VKPHRNDDLAISGCLVVASRNRGKRLEVEHELSGLGLKVMSLDEAGVSADLPLPEDGDTFEHNALSKARAAFAHLGGWVLADDSGLCVDALGGAPGVYSARYAGATGTAAERDRANNEKLLHALRAYPPADRGARFVCCVALVGPGDNLLQARGECPGRILEHPRGSGGFGYDPLFAPSGENRSMAELGLLEKNRLSHRGQALRALAGLLRSRMAIPLSDDQ
jgi:XTP/dITP diphosphohydrolase